MNYREVTRRLVILGCHELHRRGGGSHRKWFNPDAQRVTSLPDWGGRDLKMGTIRAVEGIYEKVHLLHQFPEIGYRYDRIPDKYIRILLYGHY